MKKIRLITLVLCVALILPMLPNIVFASFENVPELSLDKCKKVEITLGDTVSGNGMQLIDGGGDDPSKLTYNRVTTYGGTVCREITKANQMQYKFDEGFATAEDELFLFVFNYWDYNGGGMFFLDYTTAEGINRINVSKRGTIEEGGKWRVESAVVSGAQFTHNSEYGYDFYIANRANNAFTKIEVYNLSPIKDELKYTELGVYGTNKAQILFNMGLLDAESINDVNAQLGEKLTRESAIAKIVSILGYKKEAASSDIVCKFSDVSEENKKLIAYASNLGIIKNNNTLLGADEEITQRELVEYFLNYFKIPYGNDVIQTARENKLVSAADYIFQPEKTAMYDNLICLAFNASKKTLSDTGVTVINDMLNRGVITIDNIIQSGDAELTREIVEKPIYCPPKKVIDEETGRPYYILEFFGLSIMKPYFTQRAFTLDNERFVFCDYNGFIYEYNIKTYYAKKIAETPYKYTCISMAFDTNSLYYVNRANEIMKMDMDTYEETLIYKLSARVTGVNDISITKDETVIGLDIFYVDPEITGNPRRSAWYDVTTGEFNVTPFHDFTVTAGYPTPSYYEMHACINPIYNNLLFYAMGGNDSPLITGVSFDRAWIYNTETGEDKKFLDEYKIGYAPQGKNYGEQNGHESWTCDGEWMVLNKAHCQYNGITYCVGEYGLLLLGKDGRERKYLGNARTEFQWGTVQPNYTHPGASAADPRWIVVDTDPFLNRDKTFLFLVDADSGKIRLLGMPPTDYQSDFHNHPMTSANGEIVLFGVSYKGEGVGCIGWMDISDLVNLPPDGERVELSETCEALDFKGFEYDLEQEEIDGEKVFRIKDDKKMYLNVYNDAIWGRKKDVTLSITYLDTGIAPVKLEYIVWNDDHLTKSIEWKSTSFNRTGTGKWKTTDITIKDANMDNMGLIATEMKVSGVGSDLVIKEITAKEFSEE